MVTSSLISSSRTVQECSRIFVVLVIGLVARLEISWQSIGNAVTELIVDCSQLLMLRLIFRVSTVDSWWCSLMVPGWRHYQHALPPSLMHHMKNLDGRPAKYECRRECAGIASAWGWVLDSRNYLGYQQSEQHACPCACKGQPTLPILDYKWLQPNYRALPFASSSLTYVIAEFFTFNLTMPASDSDSTFSSKTHHRNLDEISRHSVS